MTVFSLPLVPVLINPSTKTGTLQTLLFTCTQAELNSSNKPRKIILNDSARTWLQFEKNYYSSKWGKDLVSFDFWPGVVNRMHNGAVCISIRKNIIMSHYNINDMIIVLCLHGMTNRKHFLRKTWSCSQWESLLPQRLWRRWWWR